MVAGSLKKCARVTPNPSVFNKKLSLGNLLQRRNAIKFDKKTCLERSRSKGYDRRLGLKFLLQS